MLISHEHRFIYIKTRKTAGTSLEIGLSPHLGERDVITRLNDEEEAMRSEIGGRHAQNRVVPRSSWRGRDWAKAALGRPPVWWQHTPAYVVRRYLPAQQWDDYFSFTIDRNPWDLVVSAHHWWQKRTGRQVTFREFVFSDACAKYSNWDMYAIDGTPVVDRVYRFGELAEVLAELGQRMGLDHPPSLPRAKGGLRTGTPPYREVYDDETRDRVAEVFRREIDTFGWAFGED